MAAVAVIVDEDPKAENAAKAKAKAKPKPKPKPRSFHQTGFTSMQEKTEKELCIANSGLQSIAGNTMSPPIPGTILFVILAATATAEKAEDSGGKNKEQKQTNHQNQNQNKGMPGIPLTRIGQVFDCRSAPTQPTQPVPSAKRPPLLLGSTSVSSLGYRAP